MKQKSEGSEDVNYGERAFQQREQPAQRPWHGNKPNKEIGMTEMSEGKRREG